MNNESLARLTQTPARMLAVQQPIIPIIGDLVRKTPGTISLGQGIVYYPPPRSAFDAIQGFFDDPQNHRYKAVEGIPTLLDALQEKLETENRIPIKSSGNRIVVSAGGNMAFMNAILAITDPGDEIILQTPYYFNHEMALAMANCRAVLVPTDSRYQIQPDAIRRAITHRTRAIVTISPNNPTGAVYNEAVLREVNTICRDHGIFHISDEAYENFVYDEAIHFSPGSIPGSGAHTISLFSLSKAYGFASWRIGYMVIPEALFESVKKIQDTLLICPPVISQVAAAGALNSGAAWCRDKTATLSGVREKVREGLKSISDLIVAPEVHGAFYSFIKVNTQIDSLQLALRLIKEHRVAVIPGNAFGMTGGCYLRIAYGALEQATVVEGIARLTNGLREILRIRPAEDVP